MSHALSFPAPGEGLYRLADDVGRMALFDQLSARQQQLHALLAMTCGDAWEVFRQQAPSQQENYLWACTMIAAEARDLIEALQARPE